MIIHDKYLNDVQMKLEGKGRELQLLPKVPWKTQDKTDYLLDSETRVELGTTNIHSLSMSLFTQQQDIEDKITVVGKDIQHLKGKVPYFAKIILIKIKEESDENQLYSNIKEISRSRFSLNLEGTMSRGTSIENRECIRVSKKACQKGFDFSILGSALIHKLKENKKVLNVHVYYLVDQKPLIETLRYIPKESNLITGAFNNVFGDMELDCASCVIKDVCDEVDGMREEHKKQRELKKINL